MALNISQEFGLSVLVKSCPFMAFFRIKQVTLYFVNILENSKISNLVVYVYDIILANDDEACLADLKKKLTCEFQIKNLDMLKYFLGIEFAQ